MNMCAKKGSNPPPPEDAIKPDPPPSPPRSRSFYNAAFGPEDSTETGGIKDEIIRLIQVLRSEHGIMVTAIECDWERYRAIKGARMAQLGDVKFTMDII
jgi:hypothetical protein